MNSWKRFKFRLRGWLIESLNNLINLLVDQSPEPNPDAVERAKAAKAHTFAVRLEWDEEDQTYFAYIPELGVMTNADTLPEALYMAGDAGKLVLEHDMAWNQYPPVSEGMKYHITDHRFHTFTRWVSCVTESLLSEHTHCVY